MPTRILGMRVEEEWEGRGMRRMGEEEEERRGRWKSKRRKGRTEDRSEEEKSIV